MKTQNKVRYRTFQLSFSQDLILLHLLLEHPDRLAADKAFAEDSEVKRRAANIVLRESEGGDAGVAFLPV